MKYLLLTLFLLTTQSIFANVTCAELRDAKHHVKIIKEAKILTKENWKNFDVIADMNYEQCKDYMTQQLIEVNGKKFWELKSNEDYCDGGNTYGVVYTEDLKTPVAHIYDYDMYCQEEGWHKSALAESNKCDAKAEAFLGTKVISRLKLEFLPILKAVNSLILLFHTYL